MLDVGLRSAQAPVRGNRVLSRWRRGSVTVHQPGIEPGHIDGDDVFCHQTTDALAADTLCRWICLGRFARTWVRAM